MMCLTSTFYCPAEDNPACEDQATSPVLVRELSDRCGVTQTRESSAWPRPFIVMPRTEGLAKREEMSWLSEMMQRVVEKMLYLAEKGLE